MSRDIRTIYTAKGQNIGDMRGIFLTTRHMWREVLISRELIWRLLRRNFSTKYRQAALGVVWAIFIPLVTVGVFIGMNRSGILNVQNIDIPYALYAIIGLTIWNVFTVGLNACTHVMIKAGPMIVKINFPKTALIFSASGQCIIEFFIRLVLVACAFFYFRISPSWDGVIIGIVFLIPIYLLMTGIGFIFSLFAGVLRDIVNVLHIALMGILLLTPIFYPITGDGMVARANVWNPFNYLVNVPRDFIIRGSTEFFNEFILTTIFSLIVFYIGWRLFYLAQSKVAERI